MASQQLPSNPFLSALRLAIILPVSGFMFAWYWVLRQFTRSPQGRAALADRYCNAWLKAVCSIAGINLRVHGPPPPPGSFIVPNHIGYADIIVIGAACPATFVTRKEILRWPIIGFILKSFDQPAVDRAQTRDLRSAADSMTEALALKKRLVVFLEGTSTGGDRVRPFRSSVVQSAVDTQTPVIPVAIRWSSTNPRVDISDQVAYWKKSHDFGSHTWQFLGISGTLTADIEFTDPIPTIDSDRKKVSAEARDRILQLTGLPAGETLPPAPESES